MSEPKCIRGEHAKPAPLQMGGSPPQSWLHSPPTQMPWGTKQPPLVRFTGGLGLYGGVVMLNPHTQHFMSENYTFTPVAGPSRVQPSGLKRKIDADEAEMLSAVNKLHISDTKMASHRAGLHALNQQKGGLEEEASGPRLVLSDELKQMTAQDQEHLLPKPLIDRMRSKNSMALVLWQPPKPRLIPYPEPEDDDGNNNNNNSGESVDLNFMPTFSTGPSFGNEDDVDMEVL